MILRGGTLFLSQKDIAEIISRLTPQRLMSEMIERLDQAFVKFDSVKSNSTKPRNGYHYKDPVEGSIEWMSILQNEGRYLMKLTGHHPQNPENYGLPTILGTLLLVDSNTGQLDAVVDASYATALRTGAASAVASKYMARANSSILGIVGCGTQGVTQVQAICTRCSPDRVPKLLRSALKKLLAELIFFVQQQAPVLKKLRYLRNPFAQNHLFT